MLLRILVLICFIIFVSLFTIFLLKNKKTIDKFENKDNKIKVVLVYADWCGHCKRYIQSKMFDEKLANELKNNSKYSNVTIQKINYDENKDFAEKYNINSFPTIIVIKDDNNSKKFEGNRDDLNELISFIDSMI